MPPMDFIQRSVSRRTNIGNTGGVLNIESLSTWVLTFIIVGRGRATRFNMSSRMITNATPAGARFFCAPP